MKVGNFLRTGESSMGVFVEQLRKDHEIIHLLAEISRQLHKKIKQGEHPTNEMNHIIEFLELYVYGGHHEMMENGLLNELKGTGRLNNAKSTEAFVQDHMVLKVYFKKLQETRLKIKENSIQDLSGLICHTLNYLDFFRRHMEKEEQAFYNLADESLSEEVQSGLLNQFTAREPESVRKGRLEDIKDKIFQFSLPGKNVS